MQFLQPAGGDLTQQCCKLVLPFSTVRQDGILEWGTVQQYKLDVQYCLLGLNIVGHFSVPVKYAENHEDSILDKAIERGKATLLLEVHLYPLIATNEK